MHSFMSKPSRSSRLTIPQSNRAEPSILTLSKASLTIALNSTNAKIWRLPPGGPPLNSGQKLPLEAAGVRLPSDWTSIPSALAPPGDAK
ncbi:hypothetical protein AXF42_Ash008967 [Apostasia shenzhenica]|uniref:Uncharacterized protein n=1 Tax=Apostasia shenzhenica TaxID=1088818 RepID=A0A2I0AT13_9ASPA|nr:hypothetical protein AXF42_Ash008967 [Apostasia shenzhenica]